MAESESVPLLSGKRGPDFRDIAQQANVPDTVACCCVESTRLAKVPVIRTMFRKRRPEEKVSHCWTQKPAVTVYAATLALHDTQSQLALPSLVNLY